MLPELIELNLIRLDEDKPYHVLAAELGVSEPTLYRQLREQHVPNDRTLHKYRRFLNARKAAAKSKRASR